MRRLATVLVGGVALVVAGCLPILPVVPPSQTTFEGFPVISYVPADPVGVVYVFHGTGGSADVATKVESVDALNQLVNRGYGYVATESTERTGDKRWEVQDPSLVTNPDLARLTRLHDHVVATTPVQADTPIFGIGMSNGARFVSLFADSFAGGGYPVAAAAQYMGRVAAPVLAAGGVSVPTQFVIAENDTTVPNDDIIAEHAATAAAGVPTELRTATETTLRTWRFQRIPGIDATEAQAVFDALVDVGIWDAGGTRIVTIAEAIALAGDVVLPPSVAGLGSDIADQGAVTLAVHQFTARFRVQTADFFDAQLAP